MENAPEVRRIFAEFNLVGQSSGLLHVFQAALTASQVADLPVLILGETGTGKQRLAEAVHKLDPQRREKPFVTVNCTALNETLAASDLFGHRKGAYTGAEFDRLGAFRAAQGGTLLLDELGELHPAVQPKLLHVLQERRLVPVGEDYEHPVDVRVIAATNRPLEDMVAAGQFRADLYERLNGWVIRIPPLRQRLEDLEPQAQFFLERWRGERSSHVQGVSAEVLDALRLLPWGGNTRQLENLIRNALARRPLGSLIELADLPPAVVETLAKLSSGKPGQGRRTNEAVAAPVPNSAGALSDNLVARACEQGLSLADAVEQFERQLIGSVLCRHHGNRTKTAAALGITERGLFNKIKKYKLA